MLEESYLESTIRWHLYRRWKMRPRRIRVGERMFHATMRSVKRGGLFVDCGANVGDVTAGALRYGMKVIAFEPDADALAVLKNRFAGDGRVTIIPKAVGNSDRTAEFFQMPQVAAGNIVFTQGSSLFRSGNEERSTRTVEVVDIVRFLRSLDEDVAVLKMDVEGAEVECLNAILDAGLAKSIGHILVETHERFSDALADQIKAIRRRVQAEGLTNVNLDWV